jgi:hypothetical protein
MTRPPLLREGWTVTLGCATNWVTIREGMIVRCREFHDEGDALEAAGLLE